jgi:hypothetical protein
MNKPIIMCLVTNLNTNVGHLAFDVNQQYILATHLSWRMMKRHL